MSEARAGKCKACGGELVQTPERTYHPAVTHDPENPCPDLIPINCGCHKVDEEKRCMSLDTSPDNFIPDRE